MLFRIPLLVIAVQVFQIQSESAGQWIAHRLLDHEVEKMSNYLEDLRLEVFSQQKTEKKIDDGATYGKTFQYIQKLREDLEEMEREIYTDSLKKAHNLKISVFDCSSIHFFITTYVNSDVVAHICKNNYTVKYENLFILRQRLRNGIVNKIRMCIYENNLECAKSFFEKFLELAEGKLGIYSLEYKEYFRDGILFNKAPDLDCLRSILTRSNYLRNGVVERGTKADECIRKKIKESGHE